MTTSPGKPKKILFISNGHGEDTIAVKVIKALMDVFENNLSIDAWPMVGKGMAYQKQGIQIIGAQNLLPSCGFATLSLKLMLRDLLAGWIPVHLRQIRGGFRLRKSYSLIVAVGDIVVIGASVFAQTPFLFIGCAKSSYYSQFSGYTRTEKSLLRKHCLMVFTRDELTVKELTAARVRNMYVGNPMMDGLEGSGVDFNISADDKVVGVLPGSRPDAEENALYILKAVADIDPKAFSLPLCFLFAAHEGLDIDLISRRLSGLSEVPGWSVKSLEEDEFSLGIVLKLSFSYGIQAIFVKGKFADVLRCSSIIIGTAGTANEQAVGLGKPLITFPTKGIMGPRYVRMKMQFFGPSALEVSPKPGDIAAAVLELLADTTQREKMAKAGKERMGLPGASRAIADKIHDFFF